MPHPWKKSISRFVTDLRSSNHRGGSMVVQTGFPTSLVDLIVRNQDRLKKSHKNKNHFEISNPVLLSRSSSSNTVFFSNPVVSFPEVKIPRHQAHPEMTLPGEDNVDSSVLSKEMENFVNVFHGDSWANRLFGSFIIFLKLYLMVIIALATKQFSLGITLSAFVLLFLEILGNYLFSFLKPCAIARRSLKSLCERFLFLVIYPGKRFLSLQETVDVQRRAEPEEPVNRVDVVINNRFHLSEEIDEIQIAKPNLDLLTLVSERRCGLNDSEQGRNLENVLGILNEYARARTPFEDFESMRPTLDLISRERRWGLNDSEQRRNLEKDLGLLKESARVRAPIEDFETMRPTLDLLSRERWGYETKEKRGMVGKVEHLLEDTNLRSRRTSSHKLKEKLVKNFIPKKYRRSKSREINRDKYQQLNKEVVKFDPEKFGGTREQKALIEDDEELQENSENEEKFIKGDEYSEEHSSGDVSHVDMETVLVGENLGRKTRESLEYQFLVLVILLGLVNGRRSTAVALTLTWILLRKAVVTVIRIFKYLWFMCSPLESI